MKGLLAAGHSDPVTVFYPVNQLNNLYGIAAAGVHKILVLGVHRSHFYPKAGKIGQVVCIHSDKRHRNSLNVKLTMAKRACSLGYLPAPGGNEAHYYHQHVVH